MQILTKQKVFYKNDNREFLKIIQGDSNFRKEIPVFSFLSSKMKTNTINNVATNVDKNINDSRKSVKELIKMFEGVGMNDFYQKRGIVDVVENCRIRRSCMLNSKYLHVTNK